jgi:hypothetical protein
MATPWPKEQCAHILERAIDGVSEQMNNSRYRLRDIEHFATLDFEWKGRMSLGLDLAPAGEGSLIRLRYQVGRTAKVIALACWPITLLACLVAGAMLPEPIIPGVSNILVLGLAGLIGGAFEAGVLWFVLSLPAVKLVREFGKALKAEELTGTEQAQAETVFEPLDQNPEF